MPTPQNIIDWLKLQPNEAEGGFFASVYTSPVNLPDSVLPGFPPVKGGRPLCSAIYYFLEEGTFSAMHKVNGDMLYHFYSGGPVQMLLLYPVNYPNRYEICTFSNDMSVGSYPMKVIPGGTWIGSRLTPAGEYALMGVSMAPGFSPVDYTIAKRKDLLKEYPEVTDLITELTRS
jgi:predicted cupin superfamily sugar epimerase